MQDNEMIDTMAKALGYRLAHENKDDAEAYSEAKIYWEKFPLGINCQNFIQLVGYHRAIKEIELNCK
jgi:hypothetical protein